LTTHTSRTDSAIAPRLSHHAAALTMALFTTLVIFSGVSSLSAPSHAGAQLAQVQGGTAQS
jgi:hypothetical protein